MKRAEMILFLRDHPNVKITHTSFDSDEYIYSLENGCIYDENGYLFEDWTNARWSRDGIRSRTGGLWEDGWKIKDEQEECTSPLEEAEPEEDFGPKVSKKAYMELRDNFISFVCSGVHNPAPYCANVSEKCVNGYGWCKQDSAACRGFSPKVERKGNFK